jgi:hypothetical protein
VKSAGGKARASAKGTSWVDMTASSLSGAKPPAHVQIIVGCSGSARATTTGRPLYIQAPWFKITLFNHYRGVNDNTDYTGDYAINLCFPAAMTTPQD